LRVAGVVGSQGQPELAVGEHVRAVGQRNRPLRALLDEQDGKSALADVGERREDIVYERGRQPSEGSSRAGCPLRLTPAIAAAVAGR
jgi:hypothetical protein